MAAYYTLDKLRQRLGGLVNGDLSFVDALNELGERAYALGRWPGSSRELKIAAANIYQIADSADEYDNEWFLDIDASLYDGVLSFVVDGSGYEIGPLSELYRDYKTGYWRFIDMGEKVDSAGATEYRRYKCPNGITDGNKITARVKKRWQYLNEDASKFPIRSISAVRHGLLALGHEQENEEQRAQYHWGQFERMLLGDSIQYEGPKSVRISFKGNYSSKPKSFR